MVVLALWLISGTPHSSLGPTELPFEGRACQRKQCWELERPLPLLQLCMPQAICTLPPGPGISLAGLEGQEARRER